MGEVILLVGPHGVGKTSVIEYAKMREDFIVYEGYKISTIGYDLSNETDFINYQHQYLQIASQISRKIHCGSKPGLVLRTIEECSFYYYIGLNSKNLMKVYNQCVTENEYCGADLIIYLDASFETLMHRCNIDKKRNMKTTTAWYEQLYKSYDFFWKSNSNTILLDTTLLSVPEIYQKIKEILDERPICIKK